MANMAGSEEEDKQNKNDSNNNNDKKNQNRQLVHSPPSNAMPLSPYHHQSYLSQYKNHINYSEQQLTSHAAQEEMSDQQASDMSKYSNFNEYDPYQNNAIYYHPTHLTHSQNVMSSPSSPGTFYVANPEYYHHQHYSMAPVAPTSTTLVQPMVAKIDAVIGATALPGLHPQNLIADPYSTPEQLKEDDFSNILAGVRKTCYSN